MSELDKALKNFWYDQGFDKMVSHWEANTELNAFGEGWREALKWVLREGIDDWIEDTIKEELNAKT